MEEVGLTVQGTHVHGTWHGPKKPKRAALLLHGFRSSSAELGSLPEYLAARGIGALAIDFRGHGRSQGERGRIDLERALEDSDAGLAWLRERCGRRPLALVGHSLGGSLALGIAARRDDWDAVVAAHPVDRLFDELGRAEQLMFHAIGKRARRRAAKGKQPGLTPRRPRYGDGYVDAALARQAKAEGYLQEHVAIGNYTFATTMQASSWAAKAKVPVLGILSRHDRTVRPEHTRHVLEAVPDVELLVHEGGHACFRDLDRGRVMEGTAAFLERHL